MRKYRYSGILLVLLLVCACTLEAKADAGILNGMESMVQPADSIDPEDEDAYTQKGERISHRTATQSNVLDYVMESRYHFKREDFQRRWFDHMFVEIGSGQEGLIIKGNDVSSFVNGRLNIGKVLTPSHTLRLSGTWNVGRQYSNSVDMNKVDVRLDHLFNISSFMYGYNPMRRLEVSTVLGAGASMLWTKEMKTVVAPEVVAGLQFKIYTGAYSYVGIEPYIGFTTDKMDAYSSTNWRRYVTYYGVAANFAHFLSNNFSERQKDSLSARAPWFFEHAAGVVVAKGVNLPSTDSWGKDVSFAIGKWFSPAIGMRIAYESVTSSWLGRTELSEYDKLQYDVKYFSRRSNARIDALVNPFGFSDRFSWESRGGAYLVGGVNFGSIRRYLSEGKERSYVGMDAGVHIWTKLSRDLQLFVEPRYSRALKGNLHQEYIDDNYYKDDAVSIDLGFTMLLRSVRDRKNSVCDSVVIDTDRRFALGLALGLPLTQTEGSSSYKPHNLSYNILSYLKYRMNDASALRLDLDYHSYSRAVMSRYYDIEPLATTISGKVADGLWNRRSHLLTLSLAYSLDLTHLFSGVTGSRKYQAEIYAGPALTAYLGETTSPCGNMTESAYHIYMVADESKSSIKPAIVLGTQLTMNVSRRMSLVCNPRFIFVKGLKMPGYDLMRYYKFSPLGGVSIGIQCLIF